MLNVMNNRFRSTNRFLHLLLPTVILLVRLGGAGGFFFPLLVLLPRPEDT